MRNWSLLLFVPMLMSCAAETPDDLTDSKEEYAPADTVIVEKLYCNEDVVVGAARFDKYLTLLAEKKVAVVGNQSSMIGDHHLVDTLLAQGVQVVKVFSPEHGFRGTANAGEEVKDGVDPVSGLPVISLYGKNKKPRPEQLADVDIVLFDIQDVGARFYTYISTLTYVMEAVKENDKKLIVLDRPNPNGHFVDGPVLKPGFSSFVGLHKVPIVHGMTVGEYAQMINDANSVTNDKGIAADLEVVPCTGWDHTLFYELPIAPSPNLPNMKAIYWYPSLCLFEGTVASIGRGTDIPFQCVGHPKFSVDIIEELDSVYHFTPIPNAGASEPKLKGEECYGYDLSNWEVKKIREQRKLNLTYLLKFYTQLKMGEQFFLANNFFDLLSGGKELRVDVIAGKTSEQISASWKEDVEAFKKVRKNYLLYSDFE